MDSTKLKINFNWRSFCSNNADLKNVSPVLVSRILFNIFLVNEFEHAVLRLKKDNCVWGPVHVSIGQEALAASVMAALKKSDKITGSHRAHHQFISKAMNFVLADDWSPVENGLPDEVHDIVTRTLAEVMGLAPGFCGGRGGSMHLRYKEAGVLGTNAIVGGGIPLATGAAYTEKYKKSGNIVVCFFGDGAINQGAFHEACNLAGVWRLPIIYFVENNLYAVGTHVEKACAVKDLSLRASSYNMEACIVDSHDIMAIYKTVKNVSDGIRNGNLPCIIEAKCYRHCHHKEGQPGSAFGYRDKKEEEFWLKKDAITTFPAVLVKNSILTGAHIKKIKNMADECVRKAVDFCTASSSPYVVREELWPKEDTVSIGIRSSGREFDNISYSEEKNFHDFKEISYAEAISAVTGRWMGKDKNVVEFGEEVANFGGGSFSANKGLPAKYPGRLINTPISEAGFVGLACGAAMTGMRPIVEIMFPDFSLVAADQLFNQIGKARHMYGNTTELPIVVRTRVATGTGYGGQHSMDSIGLFALFPGWRIIAPSNAFDYIGLFNTSMQSLDPVLIIEHHSLYTKKSRVPKDSLDYFIPFGKSNLISEGTDITVIVYGVMVGRLKNLIKEINKENISVEIIDLRTLDLPCIDYESIGCSVQKTGSVVIVEESPLSQAIGPRIAARITEDFFDYLDAPPVCLSSKDVPNSVSRVLEKAAIINDDEIVEAVTKTAKRSFNPRG